MRHSLLLSRYTISAILPYFVLVWLLLSVILFVQQGSRYTDLIFDTMLPDYLIWQLTFALIPSVLAFTGPIALLVGVVIGLSRMQGDSEMTAIRAAGVGNPQIVIPVLLLGLLISGFAFFINLKGLPFAAQIVRQVALKAALYKLQSPVDPGVFNTEIDRLTIFVREGDVESGKWKKIFILQKTEPGRPSRLITAKQGFVANKGENSEIVLENAQIVSLGDSGSAQFALERVDRLRVLVKTKRGEIIEKLAKSKETPEEMGLRELGQFAYAQTGQARTEALLLWQRRLILSGTPLIFALLGAALVSKFNRGGRGFGIVLALGSFVLYYLVTLLGEQLARTGSISVFAGGILPLVLSAITILWLFLSRRININEIALFARITRIAGSIRAPRVGTGRTRSFFSTAILDKDIVFTVLKNYLLALGFLLVMYLVFTAFELWKFAGTIENGVSLLARYLFFLTPYVYLQISPSALMVAAIAAYFIKTRQNEVVTWTAAGRSVYRLLLPCFVLALFIGGFNLLVQETVIASTNRVQDMLRAQIRSRNLLLQRKNGYWLAGKNVVLSFERNAASDNEKKVEKLKIYEFDAVTAALKAVTTAEAAVWKGSRVDFLKPATIYSWSDEGRLIVTSGKSHADTGTDPFQGAIVKPSHLSISETRARIETVVSPADVRTYSVSLHQKFTAPFVPLLIILLTAPFALSIHRTGNVVTIVYAAGLWLLFIGATSIFAQFGQSGLLPPWMAVWSPLLIMGLVGLVLLSRVRT